jgi:hypothetical protein
MLNLNALQSQYKWLYFVYQKLIIPDDTNTLAIKLKIDKTSNRNKNAIFIM